MLASSAAAAAAAASGKAAAAAAAAASSTGKSLPYKLLRACLRVHNWSALHVHRLLVAIQDKP